MSNPSRRKTILITAGPTIEPLDPVRYLSNYSTGTMGYELAKAARKRGHKVILVSGPTTLKPPKGVQFIAVNTALEMKRAALRYFKKSDCAIMTAAVSDFRPMAKSGKKIKKSSKKILFLKLKRNPDILSALARAKGRRILAGYSLETERALENAKGKMLSKDLDLIVVNKIGKRLDPFGLGAKDIAIIDRSGTVKRVEDSSKAKIANILLDKLKTLW